MKYFFLLLPVLIFCQTQKDSINTEKDSIANYKISWYFRTMPIAITTGSDTKGETISQRITRNFEFGISFSSIDVGLAIGEYRNMISDNSAKKYTQLRFSLDAFQLNRFSNEISVGAGYMFNSKTPLILEISSTLFYQVTNQWGVGFVYGNSDFVGDYDDSNKSFFGLYFRWGLQRNEGGILTKRIRMLQVSKRHQNKKTSRKIF